MQDTAVGQLDINPYDGASATAIVGVHARAGGHLWSCEHVGGCGWRLWKDDGYFEVMVIMTDNILVYI